MRYYETLLETDRGGFNVIVDKTYEEIDPADCFDDTVSDIDAIRKDIDEHIAAAPGAEFTFATVSVHVLGTDLAVATAPFTVTLPVDGKPAQLKGAASMVVRRSAGQLLIVHDHYSLQHE